MGIAAQALDDSINHHTYTVSGEQHSFVVPVAFLDKGIDCAGFSIKREILYDHIVVFELANIPAEALL